MALAASVSAALYQASGDGAKTTLPGHQLLMTSTVLIRCIRLLLGCESRLKSRERRLRRVGHLEAKSACAKRLVSPLLAANPLNHTPKNFI
jgi:hypothetical protein